MDHQSSGNSRRCRGKTTAGECSSRSLSPNWLELPQEVTAAILQKVPTIEILKSVQMVCTQWHRMCKEEPLIWRTVDLGGPLLDRRSFDDYDVICSIAVNRSAGCLTQLCINRFANDNLLNYVTQRCTKIQRLRFIYCRRITDEGLCRIANRLPLLEDLEISHCDEITELTLQRFGECCPHLKSLKINRWGSRNAAWEDGEAVTIGKHMPELRHLQVFGNGMSKSGLDAILEGCPHLESLDLRQCFNIYLKKPTTWREIRDERGIKQLRSPDDSTNDYEYDYGLVYSDDDSDDGSDNDSDDDSDDDSDNDSDDLGHEGYPRYDCGCIICLTSPHG